MDRHHMRQGREQMTRATAVLLVLTTTVACQEAYPTRSATIDNQSSVDVGVGWSSTPGLSLQNVAAGTKTRVSFKSLEDCTFTKTVELYGLKRGASGAMYDDPFDVAAARAVKAKVSEPQTEFWCFKNMLVIVDAP
jgi:hypothetical protein